MILMRRFDRVSRALQSIQPLVQMSFVDPLLRKLFAASKRRRTRRRTETAVEREILSRNLSIVRETEVRDLIAIMDAMLGLVAVQNPMHTKQTGGRQLPIEKEIIARPTQQTLSCHPVDEVAIVENETESVTSNDHIVGAATIRSLASIVREGIEMMKGTESIEGELIQEEASMSCPMVTISLVEVDDEGLTVISKVQAVEEILRERGERGHPHHVSIPRLLCVTAITGLG